MNEKPKFIKRINKKECPKCGRNDVIEIREGYVGGIPPNEDIPNQSRLFYVCKKCKERFILIKDSEN